MGEWCVLEPSEKNYDRTLADEFAFVPGVCLHQETMSKNPLSGQLLRK
jgi:hypothetical protein